MESPDSSYVSSPEVPPKRSGPPTFPPRDDMERPTYMRFLVSNAAAGSVIIKGMSDRIIMISGAINEILNAMELILAKFLSEVCAEDGDVDPISKVRLIIPNSSCGGIIGKGGATIKSFIEDSKASINPLRILIVLDDCGNSSAIGVADEHIGVVLGRGGRNIMEISQVSGARIKISDRGDFVSGTSDRKVTITGSQGAIRVAEAMIMQKVASATER